MTKIEVTQDHIRAGVKCDPLRCPVSQAIFDAFYSPELTVVVDQSEIAFYYRDKKTRAVIPKEEVKAFITNYDRGLRVAPFSFDLE